MTKLEKEQIGQDQVEKDQAKKEQVKKDHEKKDSVNKEQLKKEQVEQEPVKKEQIKKDVLLIISTFTTLKPNELKDEYVLRLPPLLIDNIGLGFLALSLRGYIKQYNPDATMKAGELRSANLTVGAVISIVILRVEVE